MSLEGSRPGRVALAPALENAAMVDLNEAEGFRIYRLNMRKDL